MCSFELNLFLLLKNIFYTILKLHKNNNTRNIEFNDFDVMSYIRAALLRSNSSSSPLLCIVIISSPPPIHCPPTNIRGTVLAPVSSCRMFCILSPSCCPSSISVISMIASGMSYFAKTCFAILQYGQSDFDITTTFFSFRSFWTSRQSVFTNHSDCKPRPRGGKVCASFLILANCLFRLTTKVHFF